MRPAQDHRRRLTRPRWEPGAPFWPWGRKRSVLPRRPPPAPPNSALSWFRSSPWRWRATGQWFAGPGRARQSTASGASTFPTLLTLLLTHGLAEVIVRRTGHHQVTREIAGQSHYPARRDAGRHEPEAPHNPKVAGSNPAPATRKRAGQGRSERVGPFNVPDALAPTRRAGPRRQSRAVTAERVVPLNTRWTPSEAVDSQLMFVSDLRHFLDIPDDAPGPARKMAEHLGFVVRVATAGEAGAPWVSALTCRRRPGIGPAGATSLCSVPASSRADPVAMRRLRR